MRNRQLLFGLLTVSLLAGAIAWQEPVTGVYSHRYAVDEYLVVLPNGRYMLVPSQGEVIINEYRIVGHPTVARLLRWIGLYYDAKHGLRLGLPNDPEGTIEMDGWGPETIVREDGIVSLGSWHRLSKDGSVAQAWEARGIRRE